MFWPWGKMNQTVEKLRKDQGLTAQELADIVKVASIEIRKIDKIKLKDVSEPLKSKIKPYVTGEYLDKIPW